MKKAAHSISLGEMEAWGITLLLIPFFSLLLATATFILGGAIGAWMFPTAIVLSLTIGHRVVTRNCRQQHTTTRYLVASTLLLFLSLLTSTIFYDYSYDGNTYHQEAIFYMMQGWNPFHTPDMPSSPWERHYAKALEIVASTIAICFNRIECGKAVNLLLILSSILITASFLRSEFPQKKRLKIAILTSLITLCPTVILQANIYYNDYPLYTFMLLVAISLIKIHRNSKDLPAWIILIATTLFAAVTKFTVGFYVYLTLAIGIIWIFTKGKRSLSYTLATISILLIFVGFGILGYHPYVTNTLGWGNPFYPLIGSNVDIMTSNTPELYLEGNRFGNLLRSLFYNVAGSDVWIPFITDSLHDYYIIYDARIAGFGPFFVYCMIAAMMVWGCHVYKEKNNNTLNPHRTATYGTIVLLLIAGCFIFEQSWWMRYVPFLWAVPILLLLYTEYNDRLSRWQPTVRNACYALLLLTQALCCGATFIGSSSYTMRLGAIYHAISPQSTVELYNIMGSQSFNFKLQQRGIDFTALSENQPSDSTMVCLQFKNKANIYLDAQTASRIRRPDLLDFVQSVRETTTNKTHD